MTKAQRRFLEEVRQRRARAIAARTSSQAQGVRLSRDGRVIMNRTERRRTAYHEAGHAVINAVVGIRFLRVSIVPWRHLLGRVERRRLPDIFWRNPIQIRRFILYCLSGGITEKWARRDGQASGLSEDIGKAIMLIGKLPGCRTRQSRVRRFKELHARADALVRRHWDVIDEVAQRLIRDKTLSECQVLAIFKETSLAALIEMLSPEDGADFLLCRGLNQISYRHGAALREDVQELA